MSLLGGGEMEAWVREERSEGILRFVYNLIVKKREEVERSIKRKDEEWLVQNPKETVFNLISVNH